MWNKLREEEAPRPITPPSPPSPPPVAPVPIEPKKEMKPVSSMPVGRLDPESRGGSASIGKAVKIVGQIFSKEDLYVDGDIEGTVEALEHRLTIGPHGTAKAGIKAREVVLQGTIQGNVEAAEKMEIKKDARLVGDVRTARIMIEDGARGGTPGNHSGQCGGRREDGDQEGRQVGGRRPHRAHRDRGWRVFQGQHRYREARTGQGSAEAAAGRSRHTSCSGRSSHRPRAGVWSRQALTDSNRAVRCYFQVR